MEPEPTYLQDIALKILAIIPNSASCERNFSLLTWLTGNKRIQINIEKLETMAKLSTFYNSNAKKELSYFANEMTEKELLEILKQTNIKTFEKTLKKEGFDKEKLLLNDDLESTSSSDSSSESNIKTKEDLILFLENGLDLDDKIFIDDLEKFPDDNDSDSDYLSENNEPTENNEINQDFEHDYDWNPEDLLMANDD